jgi:hypothetical protein
MQAQRSSGPSKRSSTRNSHFVAAEDIGGDGPGVVVAALAHAGLDRDGRLLRRRRGPGPRGPPADQLSSRQCALRVVRIDAMSEPSPRAAIPEFGVGAGRSDHVLALVLERCPVVNPDQLRVVPEALKEVALAARTKNLAVHHGGDGSARDAGANVMSWVGGGG